MVNHMVMKCQMVVDTLTEMENVHHCPFGGRCKSSKSMNDWKHWRRSKTSNHSCSKTERWKEDTKVAYHAQSGWGQGKNTNGMILLRTVLSFPKKYMKFPMCCWKFWVWQHRVKHLRKVCRVQNCVGMTSLYIYIYAILCVYIYIHYIFI